MGLAQLSNLIVVSFLHCVFSISVCDIQRSGYVYSSLSENDKNFEFILQISLTCCCIEPHTATPNRAQERETEVSNRISFWLYTTLTVSSDKNQDRVIELFNFETFLKSYDHYSLVRSSCMQKAIHVSLQAYTFDCRSFSLMLRVRNY